MTNQRCPKCGAYPGDFHRGALRNNRPDPSDKHVCPWFSEKRFVQDTLDQMGLPSVYIPYRWDPPYLRCRGMLNDE